ncbi:MAG: SPL family radical SAM protein [Candidatus Woesearchaeota archaeon]
MLKVIERKAKSIFTKSRISDYSINQYVGCSHACLYCYAKFICRWKNYGFWGSWVEIKNNAPELVKGKLISGEVFMSSVSDPYQTIEKERMLTRRVLENMNKNIKLSILTKSDLVLRDVDLFKKFKNVKVGVTINGFEGEVKSFLEPNAPSHKKRVNALKILRENSINNYCFVSPIIPNLLNFKDVIEQTKEFCSSYFFEFINVKLAGNYFLRVLKENYPESYEIIANNSKFFDFINSARIEIENYTKKNNVEVRGIILHH